MPLLNINNLQHNNFPYQIHGLGTSKPLSQLSRKRVTSAVRTALRNIFGPNNVTVSCNAIFSNGRWCGCCVINQSCYIWEVY